MSRQGGRIGNRFAVATFEILTSRGSGHRRHATVHPAAPALSEKQTSHPFKEATMASTKEKTLDDLFYETLKDIYFAEKQILKALPKMAKAAQSAELKQAFETHREQTEGHVDRLEQVFEIIQKPARGKTCDAILGLIDEGKEVMEDFAKMPALDAGLLAGAQAVEHYEISRYGTLKAWALKLGHSDAASLLDQTLREEEKTDKLLTGLAEKSVNMAAAA
jgi:ferritin-like metal-binding protein YciE